MKKGKVKVLYLESESIGYFKKVKVEEGKINIGNKSFIVENSAPILIKKRFGGYEPLYILKYNAVEPATNLHPKFDESKKYTPELIRKLINLKVFGNVLPFKKPFEISGVLLLIIGLVLGMAVLYALIYYNIIPVG